MKKQNKKSAVAIAVQPKTQAIALTDQVMAQSVLHQQAVMVAVEDMRAKWQNALHGETAEYNKRRQDMQALITGIEASKDGWAAEARESLNGGVLKRNLEACTSLPASVFGADNALEFSLNFIPVVTLNEAYIEWKAKITKADSRYTGIDMQGMLPALPQMVELQMKMQAAQAVIEVHASKVGKLQYALLRLPDVKRSLEARAARLTLSASADGAELLKALSQGIQAALPPEIRDLMTA